MSLFGVEYYEQDEPVGRAGGIRITIESRPPYDHPVKTPTYDVHL